MMTDQEIVKPYENALKDMTTGKLIQEMDYTQAVIDEETSWVEAITAELRIRKGNKQ